METHPVLLAFNRGMVSPLATARVDLKRMALSAEVQTNWMPRVLGAMMLRPGTRLIGNTYMYAAGVYLPFVFSTDDTALLELTDYRLRVFINDTPLTRVAVSSAVSNGEFTTDLTGWTDSDESGGVSSWSALGGGSLALIGNGTASAMRDQQITVAAGDQNKEHGLAIFVARSNVVLRVGSTQGGVDYIDAIALGPGAHSIAFTPTGNFWIRLSSNSPTTALINSVAVESAGVVSLTTIWPASTIKDVRFDQSGDVVFCACYGYRQQRIERQAARSWSVVDYVSSDGPFRFMNTTLTTLTAGALSGSTSLTASKPTFKTTNVGSLYRLSSSGQNVVSPITAENIFTDPIRVTGIDSGRIFAVNISGTWSATVTLQRSVGDVGDWTDVEDYTVNTIKSFDDTLDNQIIYYRLGVKTGNFTSGSVSAGLAYAAGSIEGICVVTGFTSSTVVSVDVVKNFGSTTATDTWWEGEWSPRRGYPSSVAFHDGRLWWAGKDLIAGSVSDDFTSFDDTVEGDSGPITRSIGSGPVDRINWLLPLTCLIVGAQSAELTAKASSLDEPLTPTAFSMKSSSTLGSASTRAVKIDGGGVFVQRGGARVYELQMDPYSLNYSAEDLTAIVPEVGLGGILHIAVQRTPDTRIHCVRTDGKVAIMIHDRLEKVTCWVLYETDGVVEDAVVLPGSGEDVVYYLVKRTINGTDKRYLEKWALESEAKGAACTILTDSTYTFTSGGAATTAVTGLSHLEGETVAVWGNSKDLGTYTVASGAITLSEAVTTAYIGLPYEADFTSAPFADASQILLSQKQQLHHVGLILADTHAQGITFGMDANYMSSMPLIDNEGAAVDQDSIWSSYRADSIPVEGNWSNNARLLLHAESPRACTVLAAILSVTGHDK